jgi:hypothetical protein
VNPSFWLALRTGEAGAGFVQTVVDSLVCMRPQVVGAGGVALPAQVGTHTHMHVETPHGTPPHTETPGPHLVHTTGSRGLVHRWPPSRTDPSSRARPSGTRRTRRASPSQPKPDDAPSERARELPAPEHSVVR